MVRELLQDEDTRSAAVRVGADQRRKVGDSLATSSSDWVRATELAQLIDFTPRDVIEAAHRDVRSFAPNIEPPLWPYALELALGMRLFHPFGDVVALAGALGTALTVDDEATSIELSALRPPRQFKGALGVYVERSSLLSRAFHSAVGQQSEDHRRAVRDLAQRWEVDESTALAHLLVAVWWWMVIGAWAISVETEPGSRSNTLAVLLPAVFETYVEKMDRAARRIDLRLAAADYVVDHLDRLRLHRGANANGAVSFASDDRLTAADYPRAAISASLARDLGLSVRTAMFSVALIELKIDSALVASRRLQLERVGTIEFGSTERPEQGKIVHEYLARVERSIDNAIAPCRSRLISRRPLPVAVADAVLAAELSRPPIPYSFTLPQRANFGRTSRRVPLRRDKEDG